MSAHKAGTTIASILGGKLTLHECPVCKAKQDEPCRTPKGRKKENVHDTRPFSIG